MKDLVQYKGTVIEAEPMLYRGKPTGHCLYAYNDEVDYYELILGKSLHIPDGQTNARFCIFNSGCEMGNPPECEYTFAEPEELEPSALMTYLKFKTEMHSKLSPTKDYSITWKQHKAFFNLLKNANMSMVSAVGFSDEYISVVLCGTFIGIEKDGYTHS